MTAIRRKRDDDSTFHSNSQCSGSLALDASQSSQVALDGSTVNTDSSMPRRRRKRRRTTIVDQLQQINISNGEFGVPNQILEQSALDDNSQISCSSAESGDEDDHTPILPPSDLELAQRAVMRDMVFGRPKEPSPSDPVDRKIQSLVRQSWDNVQNGQNPFQFESNEISQSQDDMHIDPAYTRPTDPGFFDECRQGRSQEIPPPLPPQRKRSNSLPGEWNMGESGIAPMDIH